MDWTIVVSSGITGVVGIAGVAGTIIAARIGGNSARETARLNIAAESRRTQLADKRRIYAHAIATMDVSVLAAQAELSNLSGVTAKDIADNRDAALLSAADAMGEVQLASPPRIADLADQAIHDLGEFCVHTIDNERIREVRQSLLKALRADLDQERSATDDDKPQSVAVPPWGRSRQRWRRGCPEADHDGVQRAHRGVVRDGDR